jgi:WhiB family transcriptional regulator, redox-sensing transcriptional regulator
MSRAWADPRPWRGDPGEILIGPDVDVVVELRRRYMRLPEWHEQAACVDVPTRRFFPERGAAVLTASVKRVCQGCPVRLECLEFALAENIQHGVWGGTSPRERRPMWKARRG